MILNRMVRDGLAGKVTFQQSPEGGEKGSCVQHLGTALQAKEAACAKTRGGRLPSLCRKTARRSNMAGAQ